MLPAGPLPFALNLERPGGEADVCVFPFPGVALSLLGLRLRDDRHGWHHRAKGVCLSGALRVSGPSFLIQPLLLLFS